MFWNPFVQMQQPTEVWTKAWKDGAARFDAFVKEAEKAEQQAFERSNEAVEESARLTKESFAYAQKLNAEWRRITLESMKKTAEMFGVVL